MEVICLQDDAFYALIDQVVQRIKYKEGLKEELDFIINYDIKYRMGVGPGGCYRGGRGGINNKTEHE